MHIKTEGHVGIFDFTDQILDREEMRELLCQFGLFHTTNPHYDFSRNVWRVAMTAPFLPPVSPSTIIPDYLIEVSVVCDEQTGDRTSVTLRVMLLATDPVCVAERTIYYQADDQILLGKPVCYFPGGLPDGLASSCTPLPPNVIAHLEAYLGHAL